MTGGEKAHDGRYYEERSPLIQSVPHIEVPTFLIGGHFDLFQRGTPQVFQALHDRGVPVKMILGPWNHPEESVGEGLDAAGYSTLTELQLRWFYHHVKGLPDPALDADIPDFAYYELGSGTWQRRSACLAEQRATTFHLSGSSRPLVGGGVLTQDTPSPERPPSHPCRRRACAPRRRASGRQASSASAARARPTTHGTTSPAPCSRPLRSPRPCRSSGRSPPASTPPARRATGCSPCTCRACCPTAPSSGSRAAGRSSRSLSSTRSAPSASTGRSSCLGTRSPPRRGAPSRRVKSLRSMSRSSRPAP